MLYFEHGRRVKPSQAKVADTEGTEMTRELSRTIGAPKTSFIGRTWLLARLQNWLAQPQERLFLLTGRPGTGKSSFSAWLAGEGPAPLAAPAQAARAQLRANLKAVHFCTAASQTSSPPAFLQSLATQLTHEVRGFGRALEISLGNQIRLTEQSSLSGERAGAPTGLTLTRFESCSFALPELLDRAIRMPLLKLAKNGAEEPILILLDGLDEAATYPNPHSIPHLLASLNDLPPNVRFILTTSPDPALLALFPGAQTCDLWADATEPDLLTFVKARLATLATPWPAELATQISEVAAGDFLYATLLLDYFWPNLTPNWPLPPTLNALYQQFLDQAIGPERWQQGAKTVVGLLAAAQAGDLKAEDLARISGSDPQPVLQALQPLLASTANDFLGFAHHSFKTFLTQAPENEVYHLDLSAFHRQIATSYWATYQNDWRQTDHYGLNHLAMHLFQAGDGPRLLELNSERWLRARFVKSGYNYRGFAEDLNLMEQAVRHAKTEKETILALVRLQAAQQVINQPVSGYTDTDLKTLVWLGREVEALTHARLRDKPREIFDSLLTIYHTLLEKGQTVADLLAEAGEVAGMIQEPHEQAAALRDLATALAQGGRYAEARAVVDDIADSRERAGALHYLAAALAQDDQFEAAEQVTSAIQDEREQAWALRDLSVALAQKKALGEAARIAQLIHDEGWQADALRALVGALAETGRFTEAQTIARKIQGDEKRAGAMCALATALDQAGLHLEATVVFNEVLATTEAVADEGLQAWALGALVTALAKAGRFAEAEAVSGTIQDDFWQASAFRELASTLAQADRFSESEKIACAIKIEGWRAEALRALAAALAKANLFEAASRVANSIEDDFWQASALRELAAALTKAGDPRARAVFDQTHEVVRNIQDDERRSAALCVLAITLADAGDSPAEVVLDEVGELAHAIQDDRERAGALRKLSTALAHAGWLQEAGEVAHAIQVVGWRAFALRDLAVAFHQAAASLRQPSVELQEPRRNRAGTAAELFTEAWEAARAIQVDWWQADALRELAVALALVGDSRAQAAFGEARAAAQAIQVDLWRTDALQDLIKALAKSSFFAEAKEAAQTIQNVEDQGLALRELVRTLAQAGHFEEATQVAQTIQVPARQAEALGKLATSLAQHGMETAETILAEAEKVALAIQDEHELEKALKQIALDLTQTQGFTQARHFIDLLPKSATSQRATALRDLAKALAEAGHFAQAQETAALIQESGRQAEALRALTLALAKTGNYAQAQSLAQTIQDNQTKMELLRELAALLARADQFALAETILQTIQGDGRRAEALTDLAIILAKTDEAKAQKFFAEAENLASGLQDENQRALVLRQLVNAFIQVEQFPKAAKTAYAIQDSSSRAFALASLANALAQAGQFGTALKTIGHKRLDEFLQVLAEWIPLFEKVEAGLAIKVLREATEVIGWVRPDWRKINELF